MLREVIRKMNFIERFYLWLRYMLSLWMRTFISAMRSRTADNSIVGAIIGIFVAMIIGAALVEPLAYDVTTATAGNLSAYTSAVTLANLVPLFFVMLIVAAAITEVVRRL